MYPTGLSRVPALAYAAKWRGSTGGAVPKHLANKAATPASGMANSRTEKPKSSIGTALPADKMRTPILTYHAMNIAGNDYGNNDHIALAEDLVAIDEAGFRILPLSEIVGAWLRDPYALEGASVIGLTCDDGSDFDFHDIDHPACGRQRSMLNILTDFASARGATQPSVHMTSFVIVSPDARQALDKTCMVGKGWWNDDWWAAAVASRHIGIANHSWDHNHDSLPEGRFAGVKRGTFESISDWELADFQIGQSQRYLKAKAPNPSDRLFAYPYGESNEFLEREYFERRAHSLELDAAFGDTPQPLTRECARWRMPRYVRPRDWSSPVELRRLLEDSARVSVA